MKSNFKAVISGEAPVLIDFYADWCGPCQTQSPIVEQVKQDFGEGLKVLKVDVDRNQPLAQNFGIRSIPTLMLFKKGKQVWKRAGLISKRDLSEVITRYQN